MQDFIDCFSEVSDPRGENIRHDLHEILLIALCTMLCGGEDCSDMVEFGHAKRPFLRQFLRLKHGIPSHDTFNRVFAALRPEAFLDCFLSWTQSLRQVVAQEIVAALRALADVKELSLAGSLRRMRETIGDIDVVTRLPGAIDRALPGRGSKFDM